MNEDEEVEVSTLLSSAPIRAHPWWNVKPGHRWRSAEVVSPVVRAVPSGADFR